MEFNSNLKKLRLVFGATQKEMADFLGITDRAYRNYELGRNEPSLSDLIRIADFFNVSIDGLLGRTLAQDTLMDLKEIL